MAFLYLSIDDDIARWKTAAEEEGLAGYPHNYLITNRYVSRLLEDLEVETIPRYLLFDRQGRLIHKNAPGPGPAVKALMDSL